MKKSSDIPLHRWQYVFALVAIIIGTFYAVGIWYNSLDIDLAVKNTKAETINGNDTSVQATGISTDSPRNVRCGIVSKDISGTSSIEISIGKNVCN
ncbi:MAG: hypothetical protein AAFQ10_10100 [Pseudomonadota bacterium]